MTKDVYGQKDKIISDIAAVALLGSYIWVLVN